MYHLTTLCYSMPRPAITLSSKAFHFTNEGKNTTAKSKTSECMGFFKLVHNETLHYILKINKILQ